MALKVTIRPLVVVDKPTGRVDEYKDTNQILLGQRVVGYLGNKPECKPKLVVRDLPEDARNAIEKECQKFLKTAEAPTAVVASEVGSEPAGKPAA